MTVSAQLESLRASRAMQKSVHIPRRAPLTATGKAEQLKSDVDATPVEWFLLNLPLMKPQQLKKNDERLS